MLEITRRCVLSLSLLMGGLVLTTLPAAVAFADPPGSADPPVVVIEHVVDSKVVILPLLFNLVDTSPTGRGNSGIHVGLFNHLSGDMVGLQLGVVNWNNFRHSRLEGMQLGLLNVADSIEGAQVGAINVCQLVRGVQVGLINVCDTLRGVQVGALNIATAHRPVPFMILVNVGWGP